MTAPFVHRLRVGYADVDRMGFVHHARHLVFLETARTELIRTAGESYAQWEADGVLLPLTALSVSYHRPARYDDILAIEVRVLDVTRLRLRFGYRVTVDGAEGSVLTGETHHAFMGPQGRPLRIDANRLALLQTLVHSETSA